MEYSDSALVRAVRNGHVLVVDEADKAPTQVTSVLRTLLDTGSMWLSGQCRGGGWVILGLFTF